jgi:hypothetical protein
VSPCIKTHPFIKKRNLPHAFTKKEKNILNHHSCGYPVIILVLYHDNTFSVIFSSQIVNFVAGTASCVLSVAMYLFFSKSNIFRIDHLYMPNLVRKIYVFILFMRVIFLTTGKLVSCLARAITGKNYEYQYNFLTLCRYSNFVYFRDKIS